jgi:5-methylcytosine-specific restriction endonuclease McrA
MPKGRIKGTYKHSEESKRKISLGCKGHYVSQKTRKRMSNLNKGKFGKKHPVYNENKKHSFHKLIRETFKYRQWRSDVFTRDNFTCQHCQTKGGYLEAHHIKQFIEIVNENNVKNLDDALSCEELWNINNGLTLCNKCHIKTDTWGRRKIK